MDVQAQPSIKTTTDVGVGLAVATVNQGENAVAHSINALSISFGIRMPLSIGNASELYVLAIPSIAFGMDDRGASPTFEFVQVPVGMMVSLQEQSSLRRRNTEAGIGFGVLATAGIASGIDVRPCLLAELGSAVFARGGLRLRYVWAPWEWAQGSVAAMHSVHLIIGATGW